MWGYSRSIYLLSKNILFISPIYLSLSLTGQKGRGSFVLQYCETSDWHSHTHSRIHFYTPTDPLHASERVRWALSEFDHSHVLNSRSSLQVQSVQPSEMLMCWENLQKCPFLAVFFSSPETCCRLLSLYPMRFNSSQRSRQELVAFTCGFHMLI